MRKVGANIVEASPASAASDLVPAIKWQGGVSVPIAELHQHGPLDGPHIPYIMYGIESRCQELAEIRNQAFEKP
jgi:hypothetical protein